MPCIAPPVWRSLSKRSEWVMPRPAVIQFISPGVMSISRADAVAMGDLALEQVGDGRKPDVRVRAHVDVRGKPAAKSIGPMWSKNTNGPTIR